MDSCLVYLVDVFLVLRIHLAQGSYMLGRFSATDSHPRPSLVI